MTDVLVTGATGFIGRAVVDRLVGDGFDVVAISRRVPHADDGLRWARVDLTDPAATRQLLTEVRPRRILHVAGLAQGRNDVELLWPTLHQNLTASVVVLEAALRSDVERVVMPGSLDEVYVTDPNPCPTSPYSAAKTAAATYGRLIASYGLDVINARIFMGYGDGQAPAKLIPSLIEAHRAGHSPVVNNPARRYDWIHVRDIADGLRFLLDLQPNDDGSMREFDIGTGVLTSIGELEAMVAEIFDRAPAAGRGGGDDPGRVERRADPGPMAALGWTARVLLRDGVRALAAGGSDDSLRSAR